MLFDQCGILRHRGGASRLHQLLFVRELTAKFIFARGLSARLLGGTTLLRFLFLLALDLLRALALGLGDSLSLRFGFAASLLFLTGPQLLLFGLPALLVLYTPSLLCLTLALGALFRCLHGLLFQAALLGLSLLALRGSGLFAFLTQALLLASALPLTIAARIRKHRFIDDDRLNRELGLRGLARHLDHRQAKNGCEEHMQQQCPGQVNPMLTEELEHRLNDCPAAYPYRADP